MVLGHVPGWLEILCINTELGTLLKDWVYSFHMPLFFALSGYVHGMKPYQPGRRDFIRQFSKNFLSLYIPCLFFSYLQAFLNFIVFSSSNVADAHIPTLRHFLMIPFIGFLNYWFLMALFTVKCIHLVFERIIKNEILHFSLWVLIFFAARNFDYSGGIFTASSLAIVSRLSFGLYYHAGYVISRKGFVSPVKTPGIFCGTVLLFAGVAFFLVPYFAGGVNFFTRMGAALCMSFSLLTLFYALSISNVFLSLCGLYSMVIYCIHNYGAIIFRLLCKFSGLQPFMADFPLASFTLCFISALLIPFIVVMLYKNVKCLRWIEYIFYPGKMLKK